MPALVLSLTFASTGAGAHDPSAYGGLFRSRDLGATWLNADAGLFLNAALTVAVDPLDSAHLLLGTDLGVMRSPSGGRSWEHEAASQILGATFAVAFLADGGSAIAAAPSGVFRLRDGQWAAVDAPDGLLPARAIAQGAAPGRVYLLGHKGLFVSADGGQSFGPAGDALPAAAELTGLAVTSEAEEVVFAIVDGALLASASAGRDWQARSAGLPTPLDAIALDPVAPRRMWAAGADRIWRSDDLGVSWRAVGQPLPEPGTRVRGIAADPAATSLVVTTHRGMYRSADGGQSWAIKEGNLPIHLEAGPLIRDPGDARTLYAVYSLMPYAEVWRSALEGSNLLGPRRSGQPRRRRRLRAAADDRRRAVGPLARAPAKRAPRGTMSRKLRMRIAVVAAGLALVALAGAAAVLLPGVWSRAHFVEYPMAQSEHMPVAVAAAADGAVWFTIDGAAALGRVRDGRIEQLPKPGKSIEPIGIAAAPDGSVWYTDMGRNVVSRMTPAGAVSSVAIDTPIVRLGRLAVAPDGAAWFAEATSYSITRAKDGALTRYPFRSFLGGPYGVAVAPDGAVWATLQAGNQLLRIAPEGSIEAFNLPRPGAVPTDVAVAADGAVWFVEFRGNSIGRFKDGRFVSFAIAEENAGLSGIAVAGDGAVWFGMLRAASLGRLRNEELETFKLPRADARPYSLAVDQDGNVWYADIHGYVGMLPARYARE